MSVVERSAAAIVAASATGVARPRNAPSVSIVVPTIGRPSLRVLLDSLDATVCAGRTVARGPVDVVVVDDRRSEASLDLPSRCAAAGVVVRRSHGRGPAAARNVGLASTRSEWVVFVDDDVVLDRDWWTALCDELGAVGTTVAAVHGQVRVPLPGDRHPTDWERSTARLSTARWITADVAVRRAAFEAVGGFDEAFRHAYREDSDLALRFLDAGWRLCEGRRHTAHPPRPAGWWASVGQQRGNADDARMAVKHGAQFRSRLGEHGSIDGFHRLVGTVIVAAAAAFAAGRPRAARALAVAWCALTATFARRRLVGGPLTRREVLAMIVTSIVIPPSALWHRATGTVSVRIDRWRSSAQGATR